jgi:Cdc6-like AAA superfamily ATPase
MKSTEEEVKKALHYFRNYLRAGGFILSDDAELSLKKYVMQEERIFSQLRRREKTSEDLIRGFTRLATTASEIALSEDRRNITPQDINRAIKRIFCRIWPFCK